MLSDAELFIWVYDHFFQLVGAIVTGTLGIWMFRMLWKDDREMQKEGDRFKFEQTLNLLWLPIPLFFLFFFAFFVWSLITH